MCSHITHISVNHTHFSNREILGRLSEVCYYSFVVVCRGGRCRWRHYTQLRLA